MRLARRPAPVPASPPAPPAASDAVPTASVDLSRAVGDNTTFHETATERQKFQVHIDFGKIFDARGDLDRAVQEYQDALKVAEARGRRELTAADEALAHRRIASALDRLGRFPQAEEHYQKARKLAPRDARVWNDAGYSYYLQGRWNDAEHGAADRDEARPGRRQDPDQPGHDPGRGRQDRGGPPTPEQQPGRSDRPRQPRLPAGVDRPVRSRAARVPGGPGDASGPRPRPPRAGSARPAGAGDHHAAADPDRAQHREDPRTSRIRRSRRHRRRPATSSCCHRCRRLPPVATPKLPSRSLPAH